MNKLYEKPMVEIIDFQITENVMDNDFDPSISGGYEFEDE